MRFGYACKTVGVKDANLVSCTLKNATLENISRIIRANLDALEAMIDFNVKSNIHLYRISSDIVPFATHDTNKLDWKNEFKQRFEDIGRKITKNSIRVSVHPGQYCVLNSLNDSVVENTIKDLIYHCDMLELLNQDNKSKIVLHIGGVYGDKPQAINRFIINFEKLPSNIKDRLVIENDDKNFNISDVLEISKKINIPVVFDNLHNELNPSDEKKDEADWIKICTETWLGKDGVQKIHYSQQKKGELKGTHSDTIYIDKFVNFFEKLNTNELDVMFEVKDKNLSTLKCINVALNNSNASNLEKEWARYKYFVLSKSPIVYNEIRELLKDKNRSVAKDFYRKIESIQKIKEDSKAEVNSAEHIWGYLNKSSTNRDNNRYFKLLNEYKNGKVKVELIKKHLLKLAIIQNDQYLINSLYFYI